MEKSYMNGKRKYSHFVFVGKSEIILYFTVEMQRSDINAFAKILHIKEKVQEFYACVVINESTAPRTFIAYKNENWEDKELFDISTVISPIEILKGSIERGGLV